MAIGSLSDWIVLALTRRNHGYKEPEMRLWAYIPSLLLAAVGYFLYGWGATAGLHWMSIAVGLCCMIAQQVSATTIATAYAMECFDQVCHICLSVVQTLGIKGDRYLVNLSLCSRSARHLSTLPFPSPCSISSMQRTTAGRSPSSGSGSWSRCFWVGP